MSRLFDKLKKCQENKDFYQAHQICRTIFVRLRSSSKDEEILNFLFDSARYFLEHQQTNSGYDLCKCYVEILNQSKIKELTSKILEEICQLFQLLKCSHDDRTEFACNVLRWSTTIPLTQNQPEEELPVCRNENHSSFSSSILSTLTEPSTTTTNNVDKRVVYHKTGHPKLHEAFAHILWEQEKNYHDSRYHYLRSFDGQSFATMLIEAHQTLGYPSEIDLFIGQTVLQYLLLRNFHTAYLVFVTYVEQHPKIRQSPPGPFSQVYPMLNFLWFLLLCLKKILVKTSTNERLAAGDSSSSSSSPTVETRRCFSSLVDAYKPSLERDSTLLQYVDRIGVLFFGIQQKRAASSNPFENLMNSLTANFAQTSRGEMSSNDYDLDVD